MSVGGYIRINLAVYGPENREKIRAVSVFWKKRKPFAV